MFLSDMSEAKQELIEIKDFDGDAIQDLVHFAYSSKLTLTVDNVQPLLYAACILQVNKHPSVSHGARSSSVLTMASEPEVIFANWTELLYFGSKYCLFLFKNYLCV